MASSRMKWALVLLAATISLSGYALHLEPSPARAGGGKGDQDRFQGTWEIASFQKSNDKLSEEQIKSIRLTFKSDKVIFDIVGDLKEGTYKLNPNQKPGHIDLTLDGKTVQGIYAFEGEQIKFCSGEPEDARPKDFKAEGNFSVVVLKRAAVDPKKGGVGKRPRSLSAVVFLQDKEKGKELAKADIEFFQGDWEVVSAEMAGVKLPDELVKLIRLSIKGDKARLDAQGEIKEGTYKIDPSKKLKTIDLMLEDNSTVQGIYKIEKETITVCASEPGQPRPTEFKTDAKSPNSMIVFTRAKTDTGKAKDEKKTDAKKKDGGLR